MKERIVYPFAYVVLLAICTFALSGCGGKKDKGASDVIFEDVSVASSVKAGKLSDMFGDYRIVRLETNDSSLIGGRMSKYVKKDSVFYVRSLNEILEFGNDGRFLRKLSRIGNGPEEYSKISDFEIVPGPGGNEIWIADMKRIQKYDAATTGYLGSIESEDFVNQIEYVNDTTLLLTTPGEKWLNVCDRDGRVRARYFDKDIPNGGYRACQYFHADGVTAWHIEGHNQAAVYDEENGTFSIKRIFPDLEGVTDMQINRDYHNKFGEMDFTTELRKDFSCLAYVNPDGDDLIWLVMKPEGEATFYASSGGNVRHLDFRPAEPSTANDIIETNDMRFLITPLATTSDNGFLFILPSDLVKDADPDTNPSLLEVTRIAD